ncbi:MAG: cbb3-type cytochrome c oxidase N-terminal domain-containing protein [Crocinitomicaceae bacterium]
MKLNFKSKKALFLIFGFIYSFISFSQETPEKEVHQVVVREATMYEKFGMSSTELFLWMVGLTVFLLIVFVSASMNLTKVSAYVTKIRQGKSLKSILLLGSLFISQLALSAEPITSPSFDIPFSDESFWILFSFDIVLVLLILFIFKTMNGLMHIVHPKKKKKSFWLKWKKSLSDAVPVENESSILLDHDYDGIKELDNNLPPWWKYGFYVTIVWAVGYLFYYHVMGGVLQEEEFQIAWTEGEESVAQYKLDHPELVTADNVELLTDEQSISKGRTIFQNYCVTCHMEKGAGGAGPNLTDNFWIYEGTINGVFNTISEGADNGMKAWKSQLNGLEIQAVASYVMQLDPILPPLGQEPKGENFVEKKPK